MYENYSVFKAISCLSTLSYFSFIHMKCYICDLYPTNSFLGILFWYITIMMRFEYPNFVFSNDLDTFLSNDQKVTDTLLLKFIHRLVLQFNNGYNLLFSSSYNTLYMLHSGHLFTNRYYCLILLRFINIA